MLMRRLSLIAAFLMILSSPLAAADWVIAYKGEQPHRYPMYTVTNGANELARYMGKVLNHEVKVVPWAEATGDNIILLADENNVPQEIADQLAGKARDTIIIRNPIEVDGTTVCLLATRDQFAHDFSAYLFLTKYMDVHWVGPGELGEVYAPQPDWQMPPTIDYMEEPDFELRFWHMQSFSGRQWLGRSQRMAWHHALGHVFDPKKYAESHPEVYPTLADGTRYLPTKMAGWQPCTSHPSSIEIATKHVIESLKAQPQSMTVSLSVNDGAGNICMCENCRALDAPDAFGVGRRPILSDRFFTFYNTVAERAIAINPEAKIAVIAYGVMREPPKRVRVHPAISVFHVQPTTDLIARWAMAGAATNLHLWLYDGGYLIMRPDMRMIADQLRMAHATGGIGVYSENIAHWPSCGPHFYVFAHLLRDVDRSVEQLYDEFCTLAYGEESGAHVVDYYRQWDEVFNRHSLLERTQAIKTWRRPAQFKHLQRRDIEQMHAALTSAAASDLTDKQRQRLAYLQTYHDWLALNAEQVFLARELSDPKYIASLSFAELADVIRPSLGISTEFKRIWDEEIVVDPSGWLMDSHRQGVSKRGTPWDLFIAQVRMLVDSAHDSAIDEAMRLVTKQRIEKQGTQNAMASLAADVKAFPALAPYLGPQIKRAQGERMVNIVPNGEFETGSIEDGQPNIPGWLTYQQYGKMGATKNNYAWGPGTGYNGKSAIGLGDGDYAELRTGIAMEQGARYRLTLHYKTVNRGETPCQLWIFGYDGPLDELVEIDNHKQISRFLRFDLDATDGEWRTFSRTFTASRGGNFLMQPAAGRLKPGEWVWFDDITIEKLWP